LFAHVQDQIRSQGSWSCEEIRHVKNDGIVEEWRHFGENVRYGDEIGCVLYELPDGPVVRMIVTRTVRKHEVRPKGPNLADNVLAVFECGFEVGVGQVPVEILGSDHFACVR
jgi:hypothetical protein